MSLISLSLVLFLIMDPLGNAKSFISYVEDLPPKRQKFIIFRELLIALGFILFFDLIGESLFSLLNISQITVYLSSGLILFLVAIKIIFPKPEAVETIKKYQEPFLVPLAIPMIAGPALLATVMLYAQSEPSPWTMIYAILLSWAASVIVLLSSKNIVRIIGTSGLTACERLMGLVLVLLAVQRFMEGIVLLHNSTM